MAALTAVRNAGFGLALASLTLFSMVPGAIAQDAGKEIERADENFDQAGESLRNAGENFRDGAAATGRAAQEAAEAAAQEVREEAAEAAAAIERRIEVIEARANWGWLGLVGLVGLFGLFGRGKETVVKYPEPGVPAREKTYSR